MASATRPGVPEVMGRALLSEMKSATRERRGRRMPGAKDNSHGVRAISLLKDTPSYTCLLVVTAKE